VKPARLYYCDHHSFPLPPGHRFPAEKYGLLREALSEAGFTFATAPLASREMIAAVHDPAYVEAFLNGSILPAAMRRIGFPWSEALVARTLASVGGTVAAARDAVDHGWGGTLAGGTHHASRTEGAGFCVFNDIAVAIICLRADGRIRRAAVVDLDVHQGDGTASIFENDPDVLTASVHGRNNYPFRKRASTIDVPLDDGAGDSEFLDAVRSIVSRVLMFAPDVVFYQSGVDGLACDRLGRLSLTHDGLRRRDEIVIHACALHGVPYVVTLGGGYADPIDLTVRAHLATFVTAREAATSRWAVNGVRR
jgi:acetoin utilization deacetylase AcuC-like enzyme